MRDWFLRLNDWITLVAAGGVLALSISDNPVAAFMAVALIAKTIAFLTYRHLKGEP